MVTQELIKYIEDLKQKNVSVERISDHLQKNHWSFDDINQAFSMINNKQVEPPAVKKTPLRFLKIIDSEYTKTILLISLLSIYIYNFIRLIIFLRYSTSISLTEVYSTIDYTPGLLSVPLVYTFFITILLVLTFKSFQKSITKSAIYISAFSLIAPLTLVLVSILSTSILSAPGRELSLFTRVFTPDHFYYATPAYLISIALIIFTLRSKKISTSVSKITPLHISGITTVFVVLSGISILTAYQDITRLQTQDHFLSKVQQKANFHVYQANPEIVGLGYTTLYTDGHFLSDKTNAVQVAYDLSLQNMKKENRIRATVFKQVGVDQNFNPFTFINHDYASAEFPARQVPIATARDQIGYSVTRGRLNVIAFVTTDNVLIVMTSEWLSTNDLINLANTIK